MISLSPERFRSIAREVTLALDAAGLETQGPIGRFGEPKSAEEFIKLLDRAADECRGAYNAYRRCKVSPMARAADDALKLCVLRADELDGIGADEDREREELEEASSVECAATDHRRDNRPSDFDAEAPRG